GDVRLVNGPDTCQGRLEIFYNGTWGTVCGDGWDMSETSVVCQQLDCGKALGYKHNACYGRGTGAILMDDVNCNGSESHIFNCSSYGWGIHNCDHSQDIGVICAVKTENRIRLVNGTHPCEGRVEVFYNGVWGTVCDDSWDMNDADVVCKQLGCGLAAHYKSNAYFGYGTGPILLDNLECLGDESDVFACNSLGWENHDCGHYEDAGVICTGISSSAIVVIGGTSIKTEGRVEVFHNGVWGTVCDDSWDMNDASVVCKQLGCRAAMRYKGNAHFGLGTGPILLDEVECSGSESDLFACGSRGWGNHNCGHYEDAGVVCEASLTEGGIRLQNGTDACQGRLEIFHNGVWGTVCSDGWDMSETSVVCQQLGCGKALGYKHNAYYGQGTGAILMDYVNCNGSEPRLADCSSYGWGIHNCDHSKDIGVICAGSSGEGRVRLVNGTHPCEGRVEVFHSGIWGTVCDDSWDMDDASVVCKQLGCGIAMQYKGSAYFGYGAGPILLDNVECSGSESDISACNSLGWGNHDCGHYEDAGVICAVNTSKEGIHLVNGTNACQGRLEIFHNGSWGTVCGDGWDMSETSVVCQQLGCGKALGYKHNAYFGQGTGAILMDDVNCNGSEPRLADCSSYGWGIHNCDHSKDIGVICAVCLSQPEYENRIRLVNGTHACEGRVEVFHNGVWGTLCDDSWDMNDANVVCKQMGCGHAVQYKGNAYFGSGAGPILLDDVMCYGNESNLFACSSSYWGNHDCGHYEDAGITCAAEGGIHLVNGTGACQGRLEIFHNGAWGTVCGDGWDMSETSVVCQQLGCGKALGYKHYAYYGQGTGAILMDDVNCNANEPRLTDCSSYGWGIHNCDHSKDIGVICAESEDRIRLVNGTHPCEGRVEVFHNGVWGTVCDDSWDMNDASVVCKQLGCGAAVQYKGNAHFGQGTGPVLLDEVECSVNDPDLFACSNPGWENHNCGHYEDAGVICTDEGGIRLENGTDACQGRLEIFHNGAWGTVCGDGWDMSETSVVCQQLGCGKALGYKHNSASYGQGTGAILMDDVNCNGDELYLSNCSSYGWGIHNCEHKKDISIICAGRVRLVNGTHPCEGRVEVFHNGVWGTVCDDSWDMNDASVVCKQLSCGQAVHYKDSAYFGYGTGPILLDNVECFGTESDISTCSSNGWGIHDCGHYEDAGVICAAGSSLRLQSGKHPYEGRVEVFHKGVWGSVCSSGWNKTEASVVCQELGFGSALEHKDNAYFGAGTGPKLLEDVNCTGNELYFSNCSNKGWGAYSCGIYETGGVICADEESIHLVNGTDACQGRLEIFHNGAWGTVCGDGWDMSESSVVCQQLGCGKALGYKHNAYYGQGTGTILMDDVNCNGSESRLADCSSYGWGIHNCDHSKDIGVICAVEDGIRLLNGNHSCEGRVEVFHNGVWGTVCDDSWDMNDASVVCKQLGCGAAVHYKDSAYFGQGTGPVLLDEVDCSSSESDLFACNTAGWGNHDCGHYEDAGVICAGEGNIRLLNETDACEGRLEIFHNGAWGTVSGDGWDMSETSVVCQQLDCGKALGYKHNAYYGQGTGAILMDDVNCNGSEPRLTDCSSYGWGIHNCDHSKDIGVICAGGDQIRLVNGTHPCKGRVEVFHSGVWGTVCDDSWDMNDASVVCKQLGCGVAEQYKGSAYFGSGTGPILLDEVECSGSESSLYACSNPGWGDHDCGHHEDAGVICAVKDSIQLQSGKHTCEGRLEIFHSGSWGTVCGDGWDMSETSVVCQQLGCGKALGYKHNACYGQGTGAILMDDVNCNGSESHIFNCSSYGLGIHNCDHKKDIGVTCASEDQIRLVNGTHLCEGRVEVFNNGVWGTVCDDSWDMNDARVVCKQLGCGVAVYYKGNAYFGYGTGPILLDDVMCEGKESDLFACNSSGWENHDCGHFEDAGVICSVEGDIRLKNGIDACQGRLEIFHNRSWGTVCGDGWDMSETSVVCQQLGCGKALGYKHNNASYEQGTGAILMDDVNCNGSEPRLTDCSSYGWGIHNCDHSQDIRVICAGENQIRLVNGNHPWEGRVEVFHNGIWGTICDDSWDKNDADIVCKQLGYEEADNFTVHAYFGKGTGPILLDEVKCSENELDLFTCSNSGWEDHNCGHNEDAGVICA
uniref:Soluble scavenger receptor cysteine-rich domain-containing protein SSC5D n=1 Tax=Latimeria chalumnae TaxID=7897 RepID=H3B609_LATCH